MPLAVPRPEGTLLSVLPFGLADLATTSPDRVDGGTLPRYALVGPGGAHAVFAQTHFSTATLADANRLFFEIPSAGYRGLDVPRVDSTGKALGGSVARLLPNKLVGAVKPLNTLVSGLLA